MSFLRDLFRPAWYSNDSNPLTAAVSPLELRLNELEEQLMAANAQGTGVGYQRYGLVTTQDIQLAFRLCSPLAAIVSQKAFAFAKGMVEVWNPASEKKTRGQFKEWNVLFRQPNKVQTQRAFFMQAYSYMQQYGYCLIDPEYPAGYNDRPMSMRVLPNYMVTLDFSGSNGSGRPTRAVYNVNGRPEEIDVSRLIIITDSGSTEIDPYTGLPFSRAACLEMEVSNVIAALHARGEMITDRGQVGIVSNSAKDAAGIIPMKESETVALQRAWDRRRGGIQKGQNKVIVTPQSVDYTPTTFDVAELGLHPEHIANVKAFCNRYSFPFTALAEGFEGKYNNSSNGRRDFQDTAIDPESMDFFEQLSLQLGMYRQSCEAYMDYSGVASVQMSARDRGLGLQAMNAGLLIAWDAGAITRNQWLEAIGEDKINRPEFDKYKWELTPQELGAVDTNTDQNGTQQNTTDQAGNANNGGNQSGN